MLRMGKTKGYQPLNTFREVLRLDLEPYKPASKTPIRKLVYKTLRGLGFFFFFTRRIQLFSFCIFSVYSLIKGCKWQYQSRQKQDLCRGQYIQSPHECAGRLGGQRFDLGTVTVVQSPPFHTSTRILKICGTSRFSKTANMCRITKECTLK